MKGINHTTDLMSLHKINSLRNIINAKNWHEVKDLIFDVNYEISSFSFFYQKTCMILAFEMIELR